jgi:hypothetical protein
VVSVAALASATAEVKPAPTPSVSGNIGFGLCNGPAVRAQARGRRSGVSSNRSSWAAQDVVGGTGWWGSLVLPVCSGWHRALRLRPVVMVGSVWQVCGQGAALARLLG